MPPSVVLGPFVGGPPQTIAPIELGSTPGASLSSAGNAFLIYNAGAGALQVSIAGGAYTNIETSAGDTLQAAYAAGNVINTTVGRSIQFSNSVDANTPVLALSRSFAGSGASLTINNAVGTTGPGISIASSGTGSGLAVAVNASGTGAGSGVFIQQSGGASGAGLVVDMQLTTTGAAISLFGGSSLFYESTDGSTSAVSGAATGRLIYNNVAGAWQVSVQGGAYASLSTGGSGPTWIASLTGGTATSTGTDSVVLGGSSSDAGFAQVVLAGYGASIGGPTAVACGYMASAGQNGVAFGPNAAASPDAVAIGSGAGGATGGATAVGYLSATATSACAYGYLARATGVFSVVIGYEAEDSGQTDAICIGNNTDVGGGGAVTIGSGSFASTDGVSVGFAAVGTGSLSITIGSSITNSFSYAVALNGTTTANNQFVVGNAAAPITDVWIGNGVSGSAPATYHTGSIFVEAGYTNVVLNHSGSALATNATNGFTYLPSCAGVPTGVPTAFTGAVPLVVNSSGSALYFYSGGAWHSLSAGGGVSYLASFTGGTATSTGTDSVVLGGSASDSGYTQSLVAGYLASIGGGQSTAVGYGATTANSDDVAVGANANTIGSGSGGAVAVGAAAGAVNVAIGGNANDSYGSIVIGNNTVATTTNQFVVGASGSVTRITDVWIGNGVSGSAPATIHAGVYGRQTAQTGADASVSTRTVGASDGSFIVSANILVTSSVTHTFTMTCAYTDEGNTARVLTLNFSQITGTFITAITNVTGASAYEGVPVRIRAKAGTTITLATTGTFTSVAYNVEGEITQVQ